MTKALFLDRDGVINPTGKFVNKPDDFQLIPGVAEAIKAFTKAGYRAFVVTNQGGVALGYLTESTLYEIHHRMIVQLSKQGARIDEVACAFHHPRASTDLHKPKAHWRKPDTGMFEDLIKRFHLDPLKSIMVGDTNTDIIPAKALGMRTYFVGPHDAKDGGADHKVSSLLEVSKHFFG